MKSISININTKINDDDNEYLSDNDVENEIEFNEASPFSTYKKFKYKVSIEGTLEEFDFEDQNMCDDYSDEIK